MKIKMIRAHLAAAQIYANLSTCERSKVGCLLVKGGTPIAIGYNGTKPGTCNCCEDDNNVTLPSVRHAEINALNKLWTSKESADGAVAFLTLSPCVDCIQDFYNAGIREVYFSNLYRIDDGIRWAVSKDMHVYHVRDDGIYKAYVHKIIPSIMSLKQPEAPIEYYMVTSHTV